MKKQIIELLNSEDAMFRLNNISQLHRWTKALGQDVDCLVIIFDNINHVNFSIYDTTIHARDYDGIIKECEELTSRFLDEVKRSLCNDLRAGYRNAR